MNFVLIFGPAAVGKMTVGQAMVDKLDYKLFHNHRSIELTLNIFDYGEEGFREINEGIRSLVFDTVSKSKTLKGFIFTLVWALDCKDDWEYVQKLKTRFESEGWEFYFVELYATQAVRLQRNKTEFRIQQKASKQDIERSERFLLQSDEKWQLNSDGNLLTEKNYVRIDNSNKTPEEVAELICAEFGFK